MPPVNINARIRDLQSQPGLTPEEREELARLQRQQSLVREREKKVGAAIRAGQTEKQARSDVQIREPESPDQTTIGRAQEIQQIEGSLETQFQQAGVLGAEPAPVPIISPEQENLGVITDIAFSLLPAAVKKGIQDTDIGQGILRRLGSGRIEGSVDAPEPLTSAETQILSENLKTTIRTEISQQLDGSILKVEEELIEAEILPGITSRAIGVTGFLAGAGATAVGAGVTQPISKFVGTDGQIQNLEQAITNLDAIHSDILSSVQNGLPPSDAFAKLDRIESIIDNMEFQLQMAAIESPEVRVNLRGRQLETRILASRERLGAARIDVAQTTAARAFGEEEIPRSLAFLQNLKQREG